MKNCPFRCCHCHEYGHLGRNSPLLLKQLTSPNQRQEGKPDWEGFSPVKSKRKGRGGVQAKYRKGQVGKDPRSVNPFEALEEKDGAEGIVKGKEVQKQPPDQLSEMSKEEELCVPMEGLEENEVDNMELGELDLDAIKAECGNKGKGYVSRRKIELLQEAIIRTGSLQDLGIEPDPQKGSKRKTLEDEHCRGRKTNQQ